MHWVTILLTAKSAKYTQNVTLCVDKDVYIPAAYTNGMAFGNWYYFARSTIVGNRGKRKCMHISVLFITHCWESMPLATTKNIKSLIVIVLKWKNNFSFFIKLFLSAWLGGVELIIVNGHKQLSSLIVRHTGVKEPPWGFSYAPVR